MTELKKYIPRRLLLQWHITERCNLRCAHCYQENYHSDELGFHDLLKILYQYKELLAEWRKNSTGKPPVKGQITVTGGEPFIRPDFMDLLNEFARYKDFFRFAILTNGSLIDQKLARQLRKLEPTFVQVSIDGCPSTHDKIRGPGNFQKTISAIKCLKRERIPTYISFTAHRTNYREFDEVARIARRLKVSRIWADRLIPLGAGDELQNPSLTPDETREFFEIMYRARKEAKQSLFGRTEIAMHRSLQFLIAGGRPYHCTAGDSLVTVLPNGDLYPCRRMPIRVGNLLDKDLKELYSNSPVFNALRDRQYVNVECQKCFYANLCRGGLKCLSYACTGNPFTADPGCWHADRKARNEDLNGKTFSIARNHGRSPATMTL